MLPDDKNPVKIYYPAEQANEKLVLLSKKLMDISKAFAAAIENCIYRVNGNCWVDCNARPECPWSHLPTISDIKAR